MFRNRSVRLVLLLVLLIVQRISSSARFDRFSSPPWCSKFPDDEAREQCRNTSGSFWMLSPSCCNVKFECIDGEYNQGLRCSVSGQVPSRGSSMKCVDDASCIDETGTTTMSTSTSTTRRTTTSAATSAIPTTNNPPTGQFCSSFPSDEPPVLCAGITGPWWLTSPSCCNVKFECLNEAYNQGFRCGTPGFVPDILQFKCIEESRCISEDEIAPPDNSENPAEKPPEIICCNTNQNLLPHPSDCSRYAQCVSGVLTLFQCDTGSIFHYQSQKCLPGSEITCELSAP